MVKKQMKHDALQRSCYLFLWNDRPELRYLCFATFNNLTTQLPGTAGAIRMAQLKALGLVKGTTDLVFFYNHVFYGFDIKVGTDKLRKEQKEFIAAITAQGGIGCEIRSLDEFKAKIEEITGNNPGGNNPGGVYKK